MNDKTARKIYTGLLGFVLLVIISCTASGFFQQSDSTATMKTASGEELIINTIIVSGTGTVSMAPDKAIVYLGVETQAAEVVNAQQSNAEKMDTIIKALNEAGIADEDIVTSNYHIYPKRDYEHVDRKIIGYVVSNQLEVTVKDIDTVGKIIDKAVEAGANTVNNVNFCLSDRKQEDARKKAIENAVYAARSDADTLGEALGVTILGPIEATTSGGSYNAPYVARVESFSIEKGMDTPILPEDVSVNAYVNVIFQFE
ncbi:MAG: SIMPL domain-containing protein [Methanosarcinales archaeon]|nr:SIMPL domain-containing protein [Methanosarcinales archaeon]